MIRNTSRRLWDFLWLNRARAVRQFKEPTRRVRFLTQDQAAALLEELPRESERMVLRYAHLAAEHVAVYAGPSGSTAQIRRSRANIRWSQPQSVPNRLS